MFKRCCQSLFQSVPQRALPRESLRRRRRRRRRTEAAPRPRRHRRCRLPHHRPQRRPRRLHTAPHLGNRQTGGRQVPQSSSVTSLEKWFLFKLFNMIKEESIGQATMSCSDDIKTTLPLVT